MFERKKKYTVAVADDHSLVRKAIVKLINTFDDFIVIYDVSSGNELNENIKKNVLPDVVLMDINMPGGNGYETTAFLHKNYPLVKVLALSMYTDDSVIIKILRAGAKGYMLKSSEPEILEIALHSIIKNNFYLPEEISGKIITGLQNFSENENPVVLTDREKTFLTLLCSEMSYKEIAAKMFVSHRTIDENISAQQPGERWLEQKILNWYNKQPWYCGFNYIPAYAINYTAMWDKTTLDTAAIDKELSLSENTGLNCLRAVLAVCVYEEDPEYFLQTLDKFLSIATGIK